MLIVSYLIEVSVQKAGGQIWGSFHQFKEAHKVVTVDRSKSLDGKLHLGGIAHLVSELLHLAGGKNGVCGSGVCFSSKTVRAENIWRHSLQIFVCLVRGLTEGCLHHWVSAARCTGETPPPVGSRCDVLPSPGTFPWDSGGTLSCSRCLSWHQKRTCAPRRGGEHSEYGSVCTSLSVTPCLGSTGAAGWCPVKVQKKAKPVD